MDSRIGNPMKIPELDLRPEQTGGVQLSDNMQQTLALLTAFWANKRVVLKASPTGILYQTSPQIKDIFHVTAVGANFPYQGENIPCSEVLIMGHPNNTGKIWVRPFTTAQVTDSYPLDAGDNISFSITNLNMLNMLIVTDTEKAIVVYSQ